MGFGDDLVATAIAKRANTVTGKPVMVGDGTRIFWSEVFENNPRLSREIIPNGVWVKAYPGHRPYIKKIHDWGYEYTDFKVSPGELYLTEEERDWTGGIYIEPNIKGEIGKNKDWGFENWQKVVDAIPGNWVQGSGRALSGVPVMGTKSFREACGLLSRCKLFVGTDGGLHHAAAALGIPAVVVWTGFSSPANLGYESHINLYQGGKPCGRFRDCDHCRNHKITVGAVIDSVLRLIQKSRDV